MFLGKHFCWRVSQEMYQYRVVYESDLAFSPERLEAGVAGFLVGAPVVILCGIIGIFVQEVTLG